MTTADPAASEDSATSTFVRSLLDRVPEGGTRDPDEILDLFLDWVLDIGFELYPAQEEALLELMAGKHVILNTPTGSGKSLVALGFHFKGLCEQRVSYYTSPIKALASEKFFALCDDLGPENVGMLTGDASINASALVRCCTAEVLSNMVLRQGEQLSADYVVMDEFHYYSDRERGVAWQIPLISLPDTQFLLMSATLGNPAVIKERMEEQTNSEVAIVSSTDRPVPLDFEYRETPLHETVQDLMRDGKYPIYVVNFTQRECPELAQNLTSMNLCSKEEKGRIREAIGDFRFDSPYGKEFRRFLSFGIGVHHAGLLPKYRLLVEQLAQQGLLKVISGTDTLGVGVNIPIRTVLFTKLCKYDGRKTRILSVRDFKQIAGRAGRRGFDVAGSVVCQAPEYVIENLALERKAAASGKRKKLVKKKPPQRGFVDWNETTFNKLIERQPEALRSSFRITAGLVVNLLQRDAEQGVQDDNFTSLRRLIRRSHEPPQKQDKLLTQAALLVRSLYRSGVIKLVKDTVTNYQWVVLNEDLQWDFSLFQALALYLIDVIEHLETEGDEYSLEVLSLVEAVLEDPWVILYAQENKLKDELMGRLKAEGFDYEERIERLENVSYPQPYAEYIHGTFEVFRRHHPSLRGEDIRTKGIGHEIYANYYAFADFIRRYGLQRSEGVLLRYLSQLYKTMSQTVPEQAKTEDVYDVLAFFRTMLGHTDSSLLQEWEQMLNPDLPTRDQEERAAAEEAIKALELLHDPKALRARLRAELHQLVRVLSNGNYEDAVRCIRQDPGDPETHWDDARFAEALAPFLADYGEIVFDPRARQAHLTHLRSDGPQRWQVSHVLLDPEEDNLWCIRGDVDLRGVVSTDGPLLRLRHIGT